MSEAHKRAAKLRTENRLKQNPDVFKAMAVLSNKAQEINPKPKGFAVMDKEKLKQVTSAGGQGKKYWDIIPPKQVVNKKFNYEVEKKEK